MAQGSDLSKLQLSANQLAIFITDSFHPLLLFLPRFLYESDQFPRRIGDSECVCCFHIKLNIVPTITDIVFTGVYIGMIRFVNTDAPYPSPASI